MREVNLAGPEISEGRVAPCASRHDRHGGIAWFGRVCRGSSGSHPTPGAQQERVSERLAAIRGAVSELSGPETAAPIGKRRMAWHKWGVTAGGGGGGGPRGSLTLSLPWAPGDNS